MDPLHELLIFEKGGGWIHFQKCVDLFVYYHLVAGALLVLLPQVCDPYNLRGLTLLMVLLRVECIFGFGLSVLDRGGLFGFLRVILAHLVIFICGTLVVRDHDLVLILTVGSAVVSLVHLRVVVIGQFLCDVLPVMIFRHEQWILFV